MTLGFLCFWHSFDVLTQGGPSRLQSLPQSAFGMHFDRFLEANVFKIIARRRMYPQIHVCRCLFAARAYDAYSAMNIHCKLSLDINRSSWSDIESGHEYLQQWLIFSLCSWFRSLAEPCHRSLIPTATWETRGENLRWMPHAYSPGRRLLPHADHIRPYSDPICRIPVIFGNAGKYVKSEFPI